MRRKREIRLPEIAFDDLMALVLDFLNVRNYAKGIFATHSAEITGARKDQKLVDRTRAGKRIGQFEAGITKVRWYAVPDIFVREGKQGFIEWHGETPLSSMTLTFTGYL